jgi:lipopolysaccharide transport system ATP-binding protein
MAEGYFTVRVAVTTFSNMNVHFDEPDVVAFQVIDSTEGDSARGDYAGHLPGVVRPMLNWTTTYSPEADETLPELQAAGKPVHAP